MVALIIPRGSSLGNSSCVGSTTDYIVCVCVCAYDYLSRVSDAQLAKVCCEVVDVGHV